MKVIVAVIVGVLICAVILVTGPEPLEGSIPDRKAVVSIVALERTTTKKKIQAVGALRPRQTLALTTQVPGQITWVSPALVAGGQPEKGEALFRIDERDYAIALASVEARYEQAQANIDLEQGRSAIAQSEWSQWQQQSGEAREANRLALREPQQAEALAHRKVILAEIDRAKLALERTRIEAPWSASVVEANAVVGQLLSVGEVTATLYPLDYGIVEIQVPIRELKQLDAGIGRIELRPVHDPDADPAMGDFDGIVRNLTDDTRLATVRIRVAQPLVNEGWAFGMHLEASLVTEQQHSLALIPADLIVSGNLIWVYREGRAKQHQVRPLSIDGRTILVEDNFNTTDALILERPIGLFDGADVSLAQP